MVIEWSPKAKRDLAGIWNYYSERNIRAAAKILREIDSAALRIGRMPLSAPTELSLEDRPEGFRSMVVKQNYKIVYFLADGKVNIAAIWDCRRDPAALRQSVMKEEN
jgi:plasmid stabilization system protein ParE